MASEAKEVIQYIRSLERRVSALERLEGGGGGGAPFPGFGDADGQPVDVSAASADGTSLSASRRDHAHTIGAGVVTSTMLADGAALAEILDDDGAGSGLDADLLDGQEATAFARLNTAANTGYIAASGEIIANGSAANSVRMGGSFGVRHYAPDGTAGWARGFAMVTPDGATALGQFGLYGGTVAGVATLANAYVGLAYNDNWQTWTPTLTTIKTALAVIGATTFGAALEGTAMLFDINHNGNRILRNHPSGDSNTVIGAGRTADGNSYCDLVAATTGGLLRIIRNTGTNGVGDIRQYGSGSLRLTQVDTGDIAFLAGGSTHMTISNAGLVGIGVAPATQKLKVLGSVAVGGDQGGTAGYVTMTNATVAVSTGTVTVKSRTASSVNSTGFLKVYVGTAAKYLPYVD